MFNILNTNSQKVKLNADCMVSVFNVPALQQIETQHGSGQPYLYVGDEQHCVPLSIYMILSKYVTPENTSRR